MCRRERSLLRMRVSKLLEENFGVSKEENDTFERKQMKGEGVQVGFRIFQRRGRRMGDDQGFRSGGRR